MCLYVYSIIATEEQCQCKLCVHTSDVYTLKFFELWAIRCFKEVDNNVKKVLVNVSFTDRILLFFVNYLNGMPNKKSKQRKGTA